MHAFILKQILYVKLFLQLHSPEDLNNMKPLVVNY